VASIRRPTRRSLGLVVSTICALVALFGLTANAGAITRSGGTGTDPWITSELPDYAPGSTVNLLGGSWQPGEAVHINVNDSVGQTWVFNDDVTATSNGDISDTFNLPNWFVATYSVTATGASGTATYTFTDSNPQTISISPASVTVAPGSTAAYTVTLTAGGNNNPCNVTFSASGLPTGATATFGTNPVTTTGGATSTSLMISTTGATPTGSFSIGVSGTNSGAGCQGPGPVAATGTLTINSPCTAPVVTTHPTDQSITYGQNTTFTGAASGTSPSVQWQVSTDGGTNYTNLPAQTSATLTLTKPAVALNGNKYHAVFTNACGSATSNAATLSVAPKNLTINGAVANNKVYNGNDSATVDFTGASLNGVVGGDTVTIDSSGYSSHFDNKNVGTNKPVTTTGVTLGGADAGNYTVSQPSGLKANITARDLTVTAHGQNKVYDGTTAATVTLTTDALSGDIVNAAYTSASFADKNVGTGKSVSVSGSRSRGPTPATTT
jgi:hypothetical protein